MSCDSQVVERLSGLVSSFICHSAGHLPDDVKTRLAQMKEVETENTSEEKVIYDLSGRRVVNPQKGLYIVNGKKVLIK